MQIHTFAPLNHCLFDFVPEFFIYGFLAMWYFFVYVTFISSCTYNSYFPKVKSFQNNFCDLRIVDIWLKKKKTLEVLRGGVRLYSPVITLLCHPLLVPE